MDDDRGRKLMTDWPILSTVTFLPLIGVLLILFIKDDSEVARHNIRNVAFFTTLFVFIISLIIWMGFDSNNPNFQMVEKSSWLGVALAIIWG